MPPVGIEFTKPIITRSKVECLSKWATEAYTTWQTFNSSLFHALFHIMKIIKACLM